MAKEREWKFLVLDMPSPRGRKSRRIVQGYLGGAAGAGVRVRITDGREAVLTVKIEGDARRAGPSSRDEFEYEIPLADARRILAATDRRIDKRRYEVGDIELDVFEGSLEGLVLAEVEVGARSRRTPDAPAGWRWKDVSHDPRFRNATLATKGMPRGVRRLKIG